MFSPLPLFGTIGIYPSVTINVLNHISHIVILTHFRISKVSIVKAFSLLMTYIQGNEVYFFKDIFLLLSFSFLSKHDIFFYFYLTYLRTDNHM